MVTEVSLNKPMQTMWHYMTAFWLPYFLTDHNNLNNPKFGLDGTKLFGVSDKTRIKPVSSATKTS